MKKQIFKIVIATGIVFLISEGMAFSDDRFERRQDRQFDRIRQGAANGELSSYERRILKREQRRIEHYHDHAWADGRLTRAERRTLNRMQDRAGIHIYNFKHNHHRGYWRNHYGCKRHHHHKHCVGGCGRHYHGYRYSGLYSNPGSFFSFTVGGKLH